MVKHSSFKAELEQCFKLIKSLKDWEYYNIFAEPVDPVALGIPDYLDVIKTPMDLGTIETRLRLNDYAHAWEFFQDLELVWKNALQYNTEGEVRDYGLELKSRCEEAFKNITKQSHKSDKPKCSREVRHKLMDLMRGLDKKQFKECFEVVGKRCAPALVYNNKKNKKEKCCVMYVHRIDDTTAKDLLVRFGNRR